MQDYERFYEEEMNYRELMGYPPAQQMMAVLVSGEDEKILETGMHYLKAYMKRLARTRQMQIIGPASPYVGKIKDVYRRMLYIKSESYDVLVDVKDRTEQYIELNKGFSKMKIQFDFNPVNGF